MVMLSLPSEIEMRRTVVQPASFSGEAVAELRSWLGISREADDAMLVDLLEASHALCESFTGQMPLIQTAEEQFPFLAGPCQLSVRPVRSLVSIDEISGDGSRSPLDASDYDLTIETDGIAQIEFSSRGDGRPLAISVQAGIAQEWASLPAPLRQGMIRLAAHHFRERDRPAQTKYESLGIAAPASVTALWRPWRRARLT
ncbi:MAG: hypothetical protein RIC51_07445 [Erythrobacter sp.]